MLANNFEKCIIFIFLTKFKRFIIFASLQNKRKKQRLFLSLNQRFFPAVSVGVSEVIAASLDR